MDPQPLKTLMDHRHDVCSVAFLPEGHVCERGPLVADNHN
jgi:hypothetical protein